MEEFKINFGNLKVAQLGFVYKDIEKQAKIFETLFNVPKFAVLPETTDIVKYRGKDGEVNTKIVISRQFGTQIELIQHISGDCIYKEFLDQGREGFHHISLFIENIEAYIEYFEKQGYEMIYYGEIAEEMLGMLLEVQETRKRRKKKS
ncbi:MAG: VOC family protein [Promethearchaeota archaeon]